MGTVLALSTTNLDQHRVSIRECHINLWILPAFLGKRYLLDVGMFLRNEHATAGLTSIRLILPFSNPEVACLGSYIEDTAPECWRVLFGAQAPAVTRVRVERWQVEGLTTHSCWNASFHRPLPAAEETYLRLRFASYEPPACLDVFGGWLGLGSRLRLDLRLFDYREHADFRGLAEDLDTKLVPIGKSYVYLVAPQVNRPELYLPEFSYIRVLEDPLWRRYIRRRASLVARQTRKMHVFAWKREEGNGQVIAAHRIFATLVPRGVLASAARLMSVAAGVVGVSAFGLAAAYPLGGGTPPVATAPTMAFQAQPVWLESLPWVWKVALFVSVILSAPAILERVTRWGKWLQNARRWIDRLVYELHD